MSPMKEWIEKQIVRLWNKAVLKRRSGSGGDRGLNLGYRFSEDDLSSRPFSIPHSRRTEHLATLGRTGTGKSAMLRYQAQQDIMGGAHGFVYFDLHGDATPFLLKTIAAHERVANQ